VVLLSEVNFGFILKQVVCCHLDDSIKIKYCLNMLNSSAVFVTCICPWLLKRLLVRRDIYVKCASHSMIHALGKKCYFGAKS